MKNLILVLFTIVVGLTTSCRKHNDDHQDDPKQKLTLHARLTAKEVQSITGKAVEGADIDSLVPVSNLANYLKKIDYRVYDEQGVLIDTLAQPSTDPQFGTYNEDLPLGKYKVVVAAGDQGYQVGNGNNFNSTTIRVNPNKNVADGYIKSTTVDVNEEGAQADLSMERVVAQIKVDTWVALPSNATKCVIVVKNLFTDFNASTKELTNRLDRTFTYDITAADRAKPTYSIAATVIGQPVSKDVVITFYNGEQVISTRTFPKMPLGFKQRLFITYEF